MKYTSKAPAKINMSIDIIEKRPDGYHEISTIMQSISLYDIITLEVNDSGEVSVNTDSEFVPPGSSNIVYKTVELIRNKYNIEDGAEVHIEKNIPVAAGLAGGSTDAAAAIKLFNKALNLRMSKSEMYDIAKRIGSDVSFCIEGGTALGEGLGDKLTLLPAIPDCYILLIKPDISVSTKEIYEGLNLNEIDQRPDTEGMLRAINNNDLIGLSKKLCNVLESVTLKKYPIIKELKQKLIEYGALGSLMSGSGPSVFGIFDDTGKAYRAYDSMKSYSYETFLVKAIDVGLMDNI